MTTTGISRFAIDTPASGRKSRNLREATQHLREEALRRYRLRHQGDDPPEDWQPTDQEQDAIIRALSPANQIDPELVQAKNEGAFYNIGSPRSPSVRDQYSPIENQAEEYLKDLNKNGDKRFLDSDKITDNDTDAINRTLLADKTAFASDRAEKRRNEELYIGDVLGT